MSRRRAGLRCAIVAAAAASLGAEPARAFVLSEDPLAERSLELGLVVRSFAFVLGPPAGYSYSPRASTRR